MPTDVYLVVAKPVREEQPDCKKNKVQKLIIEVVDYSSSC
jgi:hypothetical protein